MLDSILHEITAARSDSSFVQILSQVMALKLSLTTRRATPLFVQDLDALRSCCSKLEATVAQQSEELARAIGHQNFKQKIQHHVKIKDENNALKQAREPVLLCRRLELMWMHSLTPHDGEVMC